MHLLIELARGSVGAVNRRAHVTSTSTLYREYHDLYILIPIYSTHSSTYTTLKSTIITISKGYLVINSVERNRFGSAFIDRPLSGS